jgi:hypothetical protein
MIYGKRGIAIGGIGSGGYHGSIACAPTCESMHSIGFADLRRRGSLRLDQVSVLTRSRSGLQTGSIAMKVEANAFGLDTASPIPMASES